MQPHDPTFHSLSEATTWTAKAEDLARRLYNLDARAIALDGYVYRNFLLEAPGGARLVLKIAPADADTARAELQLAALSYLQDQALAVPCPRPVTGNNGVCLQRSDGHQLFALEWLPGVLMADANRPPGLFYAVGRATAQLHQALERFTHPGLAHQCPWDLRHALAARERLHCIADPERRNLVAKVLDVFETRVSPAFSRLEQGPIHGDLNDHNILVAEDEVTGILDFGDIMSSALVGDVAIAAAYAMFETPDPFDAAARILAAYQQCRSLKADELALAPEMIATRLAFSVTASAYGADLRPDDPYLSVSEKPAWATLALLDDAGLDRLRENIHRACFP